MSEREQVLCRLLRSRGVHRRDARDALRRLLPRIDDDEGKAVALEGEQLVARLLGEHQDRPVGRSVHQTLDDGDLAVVPVQRRREDDPHVALVERLGSAFEQRPEVGVADERQHQADHPRPAARERARTAVRREPVLAHDLQHRLPGFRSDVGPVVQDARDRGDGDAGEIGDVPDRRAAAERRVWMRVGLCHGALLNHPEPFPAILGSLKPIFPRLIAHRP